MGAALTWATLSSPQKVFMQEEKSKPNDLSAKDIIDVGKDSVKQAAALTKGVRDLASKYLVKKPQS